MRVLYLADAVFQDLPGGSKRVAWELAGGMARRGHDVTFLVPSHAGDAPPEEDRESVRIVRDPKGDGSALRFVRAGQDACARLWACGGFDLVHTHFAYAARGPLQAVPSGVPRVRTFHGFWDEEAWVQETRPSRNTAGQMKAFLKRRVRARIEADDLRGSDAVIALSDYSAGLLRDRGVPPERIRVIPPGVDGRRFTPPSDRAALRRRLGLPPDRRILLSVRRLAPRMGLDDLIRAMPAVVARFPDALLLIGGRGPEQARLEALSASLGMGKSVRLLGFVPEESLADFYGATDLFVLPTVALEGFGLVILEAMACGLPVIGTPIGAIPEGLSSFDSRLVAGDATPSALAEAITRFWNGNWGRGLALARLHDQVCRRFSWETNTDTVQSLYTGLGRNAARNGRLAV